LDIGKDSPAVGTGLQAGDVILKFDGKDIDEMRKLPRYVADTKIGKKVDLVVWRKGKEVTISTKIGELPADKDNPDQNGAKGKDDDSDAAQSDAKTMVLGMSVRVLTPQIRQELGVKPTVKGLVVEEIDRTGEAAKRGIRPGDIILDINQTTV